MIQAKNLSSETKPFPRKKLLFVITKSNFGGAQRYVYDLASHLKDKFDVSVAFGNGPMSVEAGILSQKLAHARIRTILVPELSRDVGFSDISAFRGLYSLLRRERPDVLHLNSSKAGLLGSVAGRLLGIKKIIFTAHGWPFWEERNSFSRAIIFFLSWLTASLSDKVICISGFDRAVLLPTPFAGKKLVVIRNGVEAINLLEKELAREKLFTPQESVAHANDAWVLTSAELTDNKNLFTGIDAVALYNSRNSRKIFWSIMGDGEELQNLEEYARGRGVDYQMKFLGYVPEGSAFFSGFDAFFLPSKKEGLPYVLLEAGLAGLPVAAGAVGGIPELIGNGVEGGIGNPRDTEALTEILTLALQHPEWGVALKAKVEHEYGMDQMIKETTALYASK